MRGSLPTYPRITWQVTTWWIQKRARFRDAAGNYLKEWYSEKAIEFIISACKIFSANPHSKDFKSIERFKDCRQVLPECRGNDIEPIDKPIEIVAQRLKTLVKGEGNRRLPSDSSAERRLRARSVLDDSKSSCLSHHKNKPDCTTTFRRLQTRWTVIEERVNIGRFIPVTTKLKAFEWCWLESTRY